MNASPGRRGHPPGQPRQLAPLSHVAHHRRGAVRIDIEARLQVAQAVCHHPRQIAERLLVGGQVVEAMPISA
jgi:hypothetical protein